MGLFMHYKVNITGAPRQRRTQRDFVRPIRSHTTKTLQATVKLRRRYVCSTELENLASGTSNIGFQPAQERMFA